MRIRCSKGIRINSFHGHFFIRSTDLLALPQVSAVISMQTAAADMPHLLLLSHPVQAWHGAKYQLMTTCPPDRSWSASQVDPDKAFAVQMTLEESVLQEPVAYIQCALLYTSSNGERRIR